MKKFQAMITLLACIMLAVFTGCPNALAPPADTPPVTDTDDGVYFELVDMDISTDDSPQASLRAVAIRKVKAIQLKSKYRRSPFSSKLPTKLKIPASLNGSKVEAIAPGGFKDIPNLEKIEIPETIISIGANALEGCTSLVTITIPSSVTHIEDDAFKGCTSVTKIEILSTTLVKIEASALATGGASITITVTNTNAEQKINEAKASGGSTLPPIEADVKEAYTITYHANGGTGEVPLAQKVFQNNPITLSDKGTLTLSGYMFTGWNTTPAGDGTAYAVASITPTMSLTLYAQWAEAGNADALIDAGLTQLSNKDIDGAIASFKAAYTAAPNNDKAKFFYSLAKLGSISVKPEMATFMRDRLGMLNYPSKMNALLTSDWMKDYNEVRWAWTYDVQNSRPENDPFTDIVRVRGDLVETSNYSDSCYVSYEGKIIPNYVMPYLTGDYKNYELQNVVLDSSGEYYIDRWLYRNKTEREAPESAIGQLLRTDITISGQYETYRYSAVRYPHVREVVQVTAKVNYGVSEQYMGYATLADGTIVPLTSKLAIEEGYGDGYGNYNQVSLSDLSASTSGKYYVDKNWFEQNTDTSAPVNCIKYLRELGDKEFISTRTMAMPDLAQPGWVTNSMIGTINGQITAYSFFPLIMANVLNGNQSGLNNAISEVLSICFGTDFADAYKVANSISNDFVGTLTQQQIALFGLDGILGDDITELKFGKAEIMVLYGALEVVKGSIEIVSTFNLDTNLTFLKGDWSNFDAYSATIQAGWNSTTDIFNNGFLNRNAANIAKAKATLSGAADKLETACNLYTTAHNSGNSSIPKVVADYVTLTKSMLAAFKDSVNNGKGFYMPNGTLEGLNNWPTSGNADTTLLMNMGVIFDSNKLTLERLVKTTTGIVGKAPALYRMNGGNYELANNLTTTCDGYAIKLTLSDVTDLIPVLGFDPDMYIPIMSHSPGTPEMNLLNFFTKYYYGW